MFKNLILLCLCTILCMASSHRVWAQNIPNQKMLTGKTSNGQTANDADLTVTAEKSGQQMMITGTSSQDGPAIIDITDPDGQTVSQQVVVTGGTVTIFWVVTKHGTYIIHFHMNGSTNVVMGTYYNP